MQEFIFSINNMLLLGNVLSVYLYRYMHKCFFYRKEWTLKHPFVYALVYVLDVVCISGANMLENPPVNMLATILGYVIPLFICYKVNNLRGFAYYFLYVVGVMVIEIIYSVGMGIMTNNGSVSTHYELITPEFLLITNLCELVIVLLLCKFGNKDKDRAFEKLSLLFLIMPVVSLLIIFIDVFMLYFHMVEEFNSGQFMRLVILLFFVNIVFFIILEMYTDTVKREMQLKEDKIRAESDADIMEMAAKTMKERLAISEQIVQQDRMMRHDRRHFEALLLGLLQEGQVEEVKKCLEERLALEPRTAVKYCENTTVNAAISHYANWAKAEEIDLHIACNIPNELPVNELELAITISNLMENAIHACKELDVEERFLNLNVKYKNQLLVEIDNSCKEKVPLDEEGFPFSINENHGVGTRSVRTFAKKNDSELVYYAFDHHFKVRMIIG